MTPQDLQRSLGSAHSGLQRATHPGAEGAGERERGKKTPKKTMCVGICDIWSEMSRCVRPLRVQRWADSSKQFAFVRTFSGSYVKNKHGFGVGRGRWNWKSNFEVVASILAALHQELKGFELIINLVH